MLELPEPYTMAALRDASWYDRPDTRHPKVYHVWGEDMMSACGRSILCGFGFQNLEQVELHTRCRRSGCRERWPVA